MSVLFRMARNGATPTEQSSAFHVCQRTATGIYADDRSKSSGSADTAVLTIPARRDNRVPKFGRDLDSLHLVHRFRVASGRVIRYLAMFDGRSCVNAMLPWAISSCAACWAISTASANWPVSAYSAASVRRTIILFTSSAWPVRLIISFANSTALAPSRSAASGEVASTHARLASAFMPVCLIFQALVSIGDRVGDSPFSQ